MTSTSPKVAWPPRDADERSMLEGFLDAYRALLLKKVAGLDREQLNRTLPPSTITLGGLVKHLAVVEDDWFYSDVGGNDFPEPWSSMSSAAEVWASAAHDSPEELVALFNTACDRSRATCAAVDSLDQMSVKTDADGNPWSLRWIYVHMIEEYARHLGHADLIRESIDGATGE